MALTQQQFLKALQIMSENHTNTVKINHNTGSTVDTNSNHVRLHITDCVPAVIDKLKDHGYLLSMDPKHGLHVDYIGNDIPTKDEK